MHENEICMYISANIIDISQFSMYNKENKEQENKTCTNLHLPTSEK